MEITHEATFKNGHGDNVEVLIMADSFGGHHVITKVRRFRKETEKRFRHGSELELVTLSYTEETNHTFTDIAAQAEIEYMLSRYMNGDPELPADKYFAWQRANRADKD